MRVERHLLAGRARPLRRRRARDRLAPPPRAGRRGRRRRAARAPARRSTTSSWSRSRRARGWSARCSSASRPRRRWPPRAGCRWRRSTTCRATWPRTSSAPEPFEPPFLCLIASGGHTLLARVDDHARLRGARADARRRRRRGVRQGRAAARAAVPGRPGARALAARAATRRRSTFPTAARRRRASTSPSPGSRPRCSTRCATSGEEEAARRARRPRRLLPARDRRGAGRCASSARSSRPGLSRLAIGGGVAANGPLRERAARRSASTVARAAARAVHRQRRDDRERRALRRRRCRTRDYLALDAYATGERARDPRRSLYGRPGCHLCDDARAMLERVRAERRSRSRSSTSRPTTRCCRALPRADPGRSRSTARSCSSCFVDEAALRAGLGRVAGR